MSFCRLSRVLAKVVKPLILLRDLTLQFADLLIHGTTMCRLNVLLLFLELIDLQREAILSSDQTAELTFELSDLFTMLLHELLHFGLMMSLLCSTQLLHL